MEDMFALQPPAAPEETNNPNDYKMDRYGYADGEDSWRTI
jgi:hypothetical protein